MDKKQICELIVKNKALQLQIRDVSGLKLVDVEATDSQQLCEEFREMIDNFSEYKRVTVRAREKESTPWVNGWCWKYEFPGNETKETKSVGATNNQSIGAMDLIAIMRDSMTTQMELQKQIFALQASNNKDDPSKWVGIIREVMPLVTGNNAPTQTGISGPPETLRYNGVKAAEMSNDQMSDAIGETMVKISKKIKGSQMLRIAIALDDNPMLAGQADDIAALLEAVNKDSTLIDKAKQFKLI